MQPPRVLISEFMAINSSTLTDQYGDYSDWIEIYNADTQTVDLTGWHLTDNAGNLTKWTFPSTNLAPNAFLLVFASEQGDSASGQELHANFKLSGSGEYLGLVAPDGTTIVHEYAPDYPNQIPDVAYGLGGITENIQLVYSNSPCSYWAPTNNVWTNDWIQNGFDDSTWPTGIFGVGYERSSGYESLIETDVETNLYDRTPSLYLRTEFVLPSVNGFQNMEWKLKYDDGYQASLNGVEVAGANDPDPLFWYSEATSTHSDSQAIIYEVTNFPDPLNYLRTGTNVLTIHGLNRGTTSSDFLMVPELWVTRQVVDTNSPPRYFLSSTPGELNGSGQDEVGPIITDISHQPTQPLDHESLVVSAQVIESQDPIDNVTLYYRIMFGSEFSISMTHQGGDLYTATIPHGLSDPGEMIRYRIEAEDDQGVTSSWPLQQSGLTLDEYGGTMVQDTSVSSALPILYWFVENPSAADQTSGTFCSLFYDGEFYDNIFVRRRGGSSQGLPKKSHKFDFNKGHHFKYHPDESRVEEFNLNTCFSDKTYLRRYLSWQTFKEADNPYCDAFLVHIQQNGTFYGVDTFIEQVDEEYLTRNKLDPNGALYKMFNNGSNATSQEKKTRQHEDNSDLQAYVNGISSSNPNREVYLFDGINIPAVINYMAVNTLISDRDQGNKNHYLYRDTEGSREWMFLAWDKDLTMGKNWGGSGVGLYHNIIKHDNSVFNVSWNRLYDLIFDNARSREMYLRRLRTLMDEILQPRSTPYTNRLYEAWIDEQLAIAGPDLQLDYEKWGDPWSYGDDWTYTEGNNVTKTNYLDPRRDFLFITNNIGHSGEVPDAQPPSPNIGIAFVETSPISGNQDEEYIQLLNTNDIAIDITGWKLKGAVSHTFPPGTVIPANDSFYVCSDAWLFRNRTNGPTGGQSKLVQGGIDGHFSAWGETLNLEDRDKRLVDTFTYPPSPSAAQQGLRITEIMYHPAPPVPATNKLADDFEFIELFNVSTGTLDLTGISLTSPIQFAFTNGTVLLPPTNYLVIVRDMEAFAQRYNTNHITIAGEYTGNFGNGSGPVKLEDAANETILDFTYKESWVPHTDGQGFSLTVIDPHMLYSEWDDKDRWRASQYAHGSPGSNDTDFLPGSIVVSEVLAHSDTGDDWIELCNLTSNAINIGGWFLSDEPDEPKKYHIPDGTILPAAGYVSFGEAQFNTPGATNVIQAFALSEHGESVYLSSALPDGTLLGYRFHQEFDASDQDISLGEHITSDQKRYFPQLSKETEANNNAYPMMGPVVISEIYYNPGIGEFEFMEGYVFPDSSVPLFDPAHPTNTWIIEDAVDFIFPTGITLPADSFFIVTRTNEAAFRAAHTVSTNVPVFGPWSGKLNDQGDRIRLLRPGSPEPDFVPYLLVDEADYNDKSPWPTNASVGGMSLQRQSHQAYGNDPASWNESALFSSTPGSGLELDIDADLLPDLWEQSQFGSLTNSSGLVFTDQDGDLVSDFNEFIAGTDANDANDYPELDMTTTDLPIRLGYQSQIARGPGTFGKTRLYDIEHTDKTSPFNWTPLSGHQNQPATDEWTEWIESPSTNLRIFRLRTRLE